MYPSSKLTKCPEQETHEQYSSNYKVLRPLPADKNKYFIASVPEQIKVQSGTRQEAKAKETEHKAKAQEGDSGRRAFAIQ